MITLFIIFFLPENTFVTETYRSNHSAEKNIKRIRIYYYDDII